ANDFSGRELEHADARGPGLVGGSQGDAATVRVPGQGGQRIEPRRGDPRGLAVQVPHVVARAGARGEVPAAGVEGERGNRRGWLEGGGRCERFGGPVPVADPVVELALRVAFRLPHGPGEPQRRRGRVVPLAGHQPEGRVAVGQGQGEVATGGGRGGGFL